MKKLQLTQPLQPADSVDKKMDREDSSPGTPLSQIDSPPFSPPQQQLRRKNSAIPNGNNSGSDDDSLPPMPNGTQMEFKDQTSILKGEEPIVPYIPQNKSNGNDQNESDHLDSLHLTLNPRQKIIKLSKDSTTIIPVELKIKTDSKNDKKNQQQQQQQQQQQEEENKEQVKELSSSRPPIDVVCVVDISGSMESDRKLDLVKDSLRFIMKILGPYDRISIVTFGSRANFICPWTRNTPENKEKLKSLILGLKTCGSTNIASGVEKGLFLLKNRQWKNPISCLFLLSDGTDDNKGADLRVQQMVYDYNIQETLTFNTFGYGKDHDSSVMNNIANVKNGNFYYIEDVKKASEYFLLSMSGMLSIVAEQIEVRLVENRFNEGFNVFKVYGQETLWQRDIEKKECLMKLNYLLLGESKEFVFEIELPKASILQLDDIHKQQSVLKAVITGSLISNNKTFQTVADLELIFLNQDENLVDLIVDPGVETNYLRTKAGEIIGNARKLASAKQYDEAIQSLNKIIDEIEASQFVKMPALQKVLEDARKSKDMCNPQKFEKEGKAYMFKKERNHLKRQASVEYLDDCNSDQQEVMDNYQNGNLCLSVSNDQDYQKDAFSGDEDQFPQIQ